MNFNPSFAIVAGKRAETLDPESKQRRTDLPLILASSQILSSAIQSADLKDATQIIMIVKLSLRAMPRQDIVLSHPSMRIIHEQPNTSGDAGNPPFIASVVCVVTRIVDPRW